MMIFRTLFVLFTSAYIGTCIAFPQIWEEDEANEAIEEPVKREVLYQSYGRSGGFRSHKWQINLSQNWGPKMGLYLIKNESLASGGETHMLGLYGSRNIKKAGVRAGYALRDRSMNGEKGKNYIFGTLRLSPFANLDLLLDYDRIQDEFVTGAEDAEKQTFSGGVYLKAFNAFRMRVYYSGQNRMKVRVSYRW